MVSSSLLSPYYLLKVFLSDRRFYVNEKCEYSELFSIDSEVLQRSVLGPLQYTIFTAYLPITNGMVLATYADDTEFIGTNFNRRGV